MTESSKSRQAQLVLVRPLDRNVGDWRVGARIGLSRRHDVAADHGFADAPPPLVVEGELHLRVVVLEDDHGGHVGHALGYLEHRLRDRQGAPRVVDERHVEGRVIALERAVEERDGFERLDARACQVTHLRRYDGHFFIALLRRGGVRSTLSSGNVSPGSMWAAGSCTTPMSMVRPSRLCACRGQSQRRGHLHFEDGLNRLLAGCVERPDVLHQEGHVDDVILDAELDPVRDLDGVVRFLPVADDQDDDPVELLVEVVLAIRLEGLGYLVAFLRGGDLVGDSLLRVPQVDGRVVLLEVVQLDQFEVEGRVEQPAEEILGDLVVVEQVQQPHLAGGLDRPEAVGDLRHWFRSLEHHVRAGFSVAVT